MDPIYFFHHFNKTATSDIIGGSCIFNDQASEITQRHTYISLPNTQEYLARLPPLFLEAIIHSK